MPLLTVDMKPDINLPMIRFENVFLKRGNKEIFNNFSLAVASGEKHLISARSGAGKTTFLKILLGYEPIDSGKVFIGKRPVDPDHIKAIRSQLFYLSQDVDLPAGPVKEWFAMLSIHCNCPALADPDQLSPWLEFFDLPADLEHKEVSDLSGGERQRLGLMTGFVIDRPVWLLDEPTSALDAEMKDRVTDKILQQDKTMIIVSHDEIWHQHAVLHINRW